MDQDKKNLLKAKIEELTKKTEKNIALLWLFQEV